VFDTHAGAGLYRLDGDYADTSAEAAEGFLKLVARQAGAAVSPRPSRITSRPGRRLQRGAGHWTVYPGSPFIIQSLLRGPRQAQAV